MLESDADAVIHDKILFINQEDEECITFCTAIANNRKAYNWIILTDCSVKKSILYHKNCLWVSDNMNLMIEVLQKVHDLSTDEHSEVHRTLKFLDRYYYWSNMRRTVK